MYWGFFDPLYLLLFLPVMAVGMACSAWVRSSFKKWNQVETSNHLTGAEAARRILAAQGIENVPVEEVPGELTDHYDPSKRVVHLSSPVFHGDTVAAVGVAAHECGHAIQHAHAYAPLAFRRLMAPGVMLGQGFSWILFIIAVALFSFGNRTGAYWFTLLGLSCIALMLLFALVTLPVEFDASFRAMGQLRTLGLLNEGELTGVRKVLTAAGMTYVVGAVQALVTLLYFLIRFGPLLAGGRSRD
ncbi:MAG: zinc metallopeptidase [Rhodanobacteraceae bacterium]